MFENKDKIRISGIFINYNVKYHVFGNNIFFDLKKKTFSFNLILYFEIMLIKL